MGYLLQNTMHKIPNNLIFLIIGLLDEIDLWYAQLVCRKWRGMAQYWIKNIKLRNNEHPFELFCDNKIIKIMKIERSRYFRTPIYLDGYSFNGAIHRGNDYLIKILVRKGFCDWCVGMGIINRFWGEYAQERMKYFTKAVEEFEKLKNEKIKCSRCLRLLMNHDYDKRFNMGIYCYQNEIFPQK